ncbi:MAG: hypothetical protein ACR2N2_03025 [Acidimicrobiia bacterium]
MTDQPPSNNDSLGDKAKSVLGCGLQWILVWVGVIIVFALIFAVGLWLFDVLTT